MPINPFVVCRWLFGLAFSSQNVKRALFRRLVPVFLLVDSSTLGIVEFLPRTKFKVEFRCPSLDRQNGFVLTFLHFYLHHHQQQTTFVVSYSLQTILFISTNDSQITFKDIIIQSSSSLSTEFTQQQQPSVLARSYSSPSR